MPVFLRLFPLVLLALTGCVVGPEPRSPAPASLGVPDHFQTSMPASEVAARPTDLAHWWLAFDDPKLVRLVETALVANTDIEAAGARVRQSRASLAGSRAGFWPTLDFGVSASRRFGDTAETGSGQEIEVNRTTYDAGFDAAYEFDLFGGQRRSVQASTADLAATEADRHSTQLTVAAEVALSYFDARLAQRRVAIAQANLSAQDETLQIVRWRVQAGLVGSLDLEQARQLRSQTAAAIPLLEQDFASAVNRLAVLIGEAPGNVGPQLAEPTEIPLAQLPQMAIPADVVRRRPDVARAEYTLVAETARIGVRQADLYPALRLGGSFGGSGLTIGDVAETSIGSIAASLTTPIFHGGQLRAAVEQQRAIAAAALAGYRGSLLVALEEAENGLVAVGATERRERELIIAAEAASNAAAIARSQYQAGLIDFQSLLEATRSSLTTQDSRATARASRAAALVQLYKALGGGWDAEPVASNR